MQIGWYSSQENRRGVFADVLDEALQHGDAMGMPYEILNGMYQQATKERPDGITVTGLLQNSRHVKLEKANDFFADVENNFATFRGTIVHRIMEDYGGANSTVEERVERDYKGTTISGQPDTLQVRVDNGRTLVRDWKSTKELPRYNSPYTNHLQQVNLYRWVLGLDPEQTDLEVVYVSMEGVKIMPLKHAGRSRSGRAIGEQHWDDAKVGALIQKRLDLYNTVPILSYANIPEDDLWQCRYSPVENLCRRLAAKEARAEWEAGRDVERVNGR